MKNTLVAVSVVTIITGVTTAADPMAFAELVLLEPPPPGSGTFFIVLAGAFLAVFGAALLHALLSRGDHPLVILWTSAEKLVAVGCWVLGILQGTLAPVAATMIGFDVLAAALGLWYWNWLVRLKKGVKGEGGKGYRVEG